MNIAFWDNCLCERGTTVSLFDYAYYNQNVWKNKSYIFYDKNHSQNKQSVIEKFKANFVVHETDNFKEVDDYIRQYNITHIYIIKSGEADNRLSKYAKNCIHCVFNCGQPHGDVYSAISPWISNYNDRYPVVPHMINLPNDELNLREELGIPNNAIVFGGYGGRESFNISFVHNLIYNYALNDSNTYFIFANFDRFCPPLPNIIHLPMITDIHRKVQFINTTDAMIWGRQVGETFGIAIGEFSSKNKPVIAMKIGDLAHYHMLGNKGLWYSDANSLYTILKNFNPKTAKEMDWNAYKDYAPDKVMQKFKDVYLS